MYNSSIKILNVVFILLWTLSATAQENKQIETDQDSVVYKQRYGLRLGFDAFKIARSFYDDDYQGFEVNGDYRLTQRIYLAGELGNEERTLDNDQLSTTSSGSYFKAGIDYNLYQNWLDMENMIFAGFRVGASTFSQTLNSFTVFDVNNQFFGDPLFVDTPEEFDGLSAIWAEVMLGIKAEVFQNFYMGLNVQLKFLVTDTASDRLENLYIPGFNRTFDSGNIGAGFGYTLSYLIPIYKKAKPTKTEEDETTDEDQ